MFSRHGQVRNQIQLLEDDGDAGVLGLARSCETQLAWPRQQDLARVRREHAGEDVHQRGLARAVLAEQGVQPPAPHGEAHVVERLHAGKDFEIAASRFDRGRRRHVVHAAHGACPMRAPLAGERLQRQATAPGRPSPRTPAKRTRVPTAAVPQRGSGPAFPRGGSAPSTRSLKSCELGNALSVQQSRGVADGVAEDRSGRAARRRRVARRSATANVPLLVERDDPPAAADGTVVRAA